jgi:hypothetical protein
MLIWKRALLLLVAIAITAIGFVVWTIERSDVPAETAEVATPSVASKAHEASDRGDADSATSSDSHRENAAGASSSARNAADTVAASTTDAVLIVRVVARTTKQPLDSVRIELTSRDLSHPNVTSSADGASTSSSTTDARGVARIRVAPDVDLDLVANSAREDVGSTEIAVPALKLGERRELAIELPLGNDLRLCGVVLAAGDARPIAGATAEAYLIDASATPAGGEKDAPSHADREPKRARPYASVTTDTAGRFALDVPSWRDAYVRVSAKTFGSAFAEIDEDHDTADKALAFRLTRSATIHARVLDELDEPIAGVDVVAHVDAYRLASESKQVGAALVSAPDEAWHATTNSDGECTLDNVATGVSLRAQLEIGGRVRGKPFEIPALAPGDTTYPWRIDLGCELSGVLLDEHDAPISRFGVWLAPKSAAKPGGNEPDSARGSWLGISHDSLTASAITDDDGRFAFRDVSAGSWCIGFELQRGPTGRDRAREFVPEGHALDVARGARRQEVVVHLRHGEYIRGKVLEASGTPPRAFAVITGPNARTACPIFYNDNELASGYYAHIDDDGVFEVGPLPHGEYELTARSFVRPAQPRSIAVRAKAKTGDEGVVLRLGKRGTISGRVIDATTREGVVAMVWNSASPARWTESTYSGSFAFDSVTTGTADFIAMTSDNRIGIVRVARVDAGHDTSDLEITVSRGAVLKLRYDGAKDGCTLNVLSNDVVVARARVLKGHSMSVPVPPGEVLVHVPKKGSNETIELKLDVKAGEERDVAVKDEE